MDYPGFISVILMSSIMGSVIVLLVLIIKGLLGRRLSAAFQYYIWFVLLVRLIIPWGPQSSISIHNIFSPAVERELNLSSEDTTGITQNEIDTGINDAETGIEGNTGLTESQLPGEPKETGGGIDLRYILIYIWASGAGILSIFTFLGSLKMKRMTGTLKGCSDTRVHKIFDECLRDNVKKGRVEIICSDKIKSPSLYGLIKPRILIPAGIAANLKDDEISYIILHELMHYKRKDLLVIYITVLLRIIHWFNPILWYGFHRMLEDCEVSCDALVLSYVSEGQNAAYGRALVNTLRLLKDRPKITGSVAMASDRKQIKRRVAMLSGHKRLTIGGIILGILVILTVGAVSLTNSGKGSGQGKMDEAPQDLLDAVIDMEKSRYELNNLKISFSEYKQRTDKYLSKYYTSLYNPANTIYANDGLVAAVTGRNYTEKDWQDLSLEELKRKLEPLVQSIAVNSVAFNYTSFEVSKVYGDSSGSSPSLYFKYIYIKFPCQDDSRTVNLYKEYTFKKEGDKYILFAIDDMPSNTKELTYKNETVEFVRNIKLDN